MKLFVVSDVHSFLAPLKEALNKAGFDPNNEDHWFISCGDLFDRGPESKELLEFIMSLERKVLVKGNHDLLLEELCYRGYPYSHDKTNGTVKTVQDISCIENKQKFHECCSIVLNKMAAYRDCLVNYFETKNYIFVHSWIPTRVKFDSTNKPWYIAGKTPAWMKNWRNANEVEWEEAMWGNPFNIAKDGLNRTGKTIVFGHWHCSTGYVLNSVVDGIVSEFDENACWEPYRNAEQGIIGIDRCTGHTGEVNVLVLEDSFLENT